MLFNSVVVFGFRGLAVSVVWRLECCWCILWLFIVDAGFAA